MARPANKIWGAAAALLALCSLLALTSQSRFVDRHNRILQDLNTGEEEIGQLGHEMTVSVAGEKDSTTAKATSSVHVPHKDASTADVQETHI